MYYVIVLSIIFLFLYIGMLYKRLIKRYSKAEQCFHELETALADCYYALDYAIRTEATTTENAEIRAEIKDIIEESGILGYDVPTIEQSLSAGIKCSRLLEREQDLETIFNKTAEEKYAAVKAAALPYNEAVKNYHAILTSPAYAFIARTTGLAVMRIFELD